MNLRSSSIALFGLAAAIVFPACSSTDRAPTAITNSKYFLLDPDNQLETQDPMLNFERRQHLHGAITRAEREAREGHYYVFWWEDSERSPAIVRLEFRQENTGSQVKVKEQLVEAPRRSNKSYFEVIGEEYKLDGRVTAWRVSIVRDGQAVASDQSYLW